jgi:hypothetical protein
VIEGNSPSLLSADFSCRIWIVLKNGRKAVEWPSVCVFGGALVRCGWWPLSTQVLGLAVDARVSLFSLRYPTCPSLISSKARCKVSECKLESMYVCERTLFWPKRMSCVPHFRGNPRSFAQTHMRARESWQSPRRRRFLISSRSMPIRSLHDRYLIASSVCNAPLPEMDWHLRRHLHYL